MAELDDDIGGTTNQDDATNASDTALFIKIKSIPRIAHGRDLRLREDDVIVAIDGKAYNQDIEGFAAICDQAEENEESLLLSICRGDIIYDICVSQNLGVELEYSNSEISANVATIFSKYEVGPKEQYCNYEALRDIHRNVVLYDTNYSALATIAPPLWLLQHRAWEPLIAVLVAYCTTFVVHWLVFGITILLVAIYFHRIQFRLIRNYNLFTEHYFWHVCAARNPTEAQMVCRQLDPKCNFDYSHVGPPEKISSVQNSEEQMA